MLDRRTLATLLDRHAPVANVEGIDYVSAWSCVDELPLWQALEAAAGERLPPPFYGLAWPGSQALARVLAQRKIDVRGRVVVDVGCGSGVASIAAWRAGSRRVIAIDVDPHACLATSILSVRHDILLDTVCADPLVSDVGIVDGAVVLAGDLVYSQDVAARAKDAVKRWLKRGCRVVLADSGRPFFEKLGLSQIAEYTIATPRIVDGVDARAVRVYASPATMVF